MVKCGVGYTELMLSYIVALVLKLSGMILNCFGSLVFKKQFILLSMMRWCTINLFMGL